MTLIEKIKEVLPKEEHCPDINDFDNGWNACLEEIYTSLPQVMEVIKGEIEKLGSVEILGQKEMIALEDIITLLSEEELTNPSE